MTNALVVSSQRVGDAIALEARILSRASINQLAIGAHFADRTETFNLII